MKWLAHTYLKMRGWKFIGQVPPDPRFIVIGAPHTTNWDFVAFLAATRQWDFTPKYLGKHTLFDGPFGWLFRRLGGIPVDRSKPGGVLDQVKAEFESNQEFALVIAPEGTRKAAEFWKSGFVKIAAATGVPIVPGGLNYRDKTITLGDPVHYDGVADNLMDTLRSFYATTEGKHPEGQGPVQIKEGTLDAS
ncbi:MAG: 1-acyl-sn-glycerol-3-phosphate acyltransferase [Acidimicrobiia bacterium]